MKKTTVLEKEKMANRVIECIPNFSEARNTEIVKSIIDSIVSVQDISLLNQSSDTDHNRTVITFAGPPEAVAEAAFQGIKTAGNLIDLNHHTGTHPRIGAADVVPFVPISGVSMEDCVKLARSLAKRVGEELLIPVYLYEEAAMVPERVNLENIRRGQFEALKVEITSKPERKPDFGPNKIGPAGATVIGARHPLIAFNVYLDTDDVPLAKAIAKKIRSSSGGMPFVKALGMLVDGLAQVSMNLTNFRVTSVLSVVQEIKKEAAKSNIQIHHSELVGLIPEDALVGAAVETLALKDFQQDQILENRLHSQHQDQVTGGFLEELAAANATPGGGAAAAYAGAMAAALVVMVTRLTIGKKKYVDVEQQMKEILNQAERLRHEITLSVQEDSKAFNEVMMAFKLPKESHELESERMQAIEKATVKASRVPLSVAQMAVSIMALAERCVKLGNLNAISDAATSASLAQASMVSAGYNIKVNVANLVDKKTGDEIHSQFHSLEKKANHLTKEIYKTLQERGGIIP
jgi:glutamate formiminotransferase/formiminotetrahydrofolate cyclodeaminase